MFDVLEIPNNNLQWNTLQNKREVPIDFQQYSMRSDGCLQILWTLVQQECVGMIIYIIANYLYSLEYSRVSGTLINLNLC